MSMALARTRALRRHSIFNPKKNDRKMGWNSRVAMCSRVPTGAQMCLKNARLRLVVRDPGH
jgi:hypothetical protein